MIFYIQTMVMVVKTRKFQKAILIEVFLVILLFLNENANEKIYIFFIFTFIVDFLN